MSKKDVIKLKGFTTRPGKVDWSKKDILVVGQWGLVDEFGNGYSKNKVTNWYRAQDDVAMAIKEANGAGLNGGKYKADNTMVIYMPNNIGYWQTRYIAGDYQFVEPEGSKEEEHYLSITPVGANLVNTVSPDGVVGLKQTCEYAKQIRGSRRGFGWLPIETVEFNDRSRTSKFYGEEPTKIYAEARIYKDRKIAIVYTVVSGSKKKYLTYANKDGMTGTRINFYSVFSGNVESLSEDFIKTHFGYGGVSGEHVIEKWNEAKNGFDFVCSLLETWMVEVKSNEEVRAKAYACSFKNHVLSKHLTVDGYGSEWLSVSNADNRVFNCNSYYSCRDKYNQDFREQLNKFFGEGKEEYKGLWNYFNDKYTYVNSYLGYRYADDGIVSPGFLEVFAGISPSAVKGLATRKETKESQWKEYGMLGGIGEEIQKKNVGNQVNAYCWGESTNAAGERIIYCGVKIWNGVMGKFSKTEKVLFTYNAKRRTKGFHYLDTYNKFDSDSDTELERIVTLIPGNAKTCENIRDRLKFEDRVYNDVEHKYEEIKGRKFVETFEFADGIEPSVLFEKTNVGYIMEHLESIREKMRVKVRIHYNGWGKDRKDVFVGAEELYDMFGSGKFNSLAMYVLTLAGDKLTEQLLKSELYNLYFSGLNCYIDCVPGEFVSEDGRWSHGLFPKTTGSNLKKMLGMTPEQLRYMDSLICWGETRKKESKYVYGSGTVTEWVNIKTNNGYAALRDAESVLGVPVADLDMKTFKELCDVTSKNNHIEFRDSQVRMEFGSNQIYEISRILDKDVFAFWKKMSVAERIAMIKRHTSNGIWETYEDYLKMVNQIADCKKALAVGRLDDAGVGRSISPKVAKELATFDLDRFSLKIDKAKRFIPFIPGMTVGGHYSWSRDRIDTASDFKDKMLQTYQQYVNKEDMEFTKDEHGDINGFRIYMNPDANLKYIHDELSQWFNIIEDEGKELQFIAAVERVKGLEWKDEEFGLEVIAPRCTADIRKEGQILEHCVASYVDPIIAGTENIMFIRRMDMPAKPYFTMDIVGGEVRQIHCWRNGDPTPEGIAEAYAGIGDDNPLKEAYDRPFDIIGFLKKWVKKVGDGKAVKEGSLKSHYGRYCAVR